MVAGTLGELFIAFIRREGRRAGSRVVAASLFRTLIRISWIGIAGIGALTVWGVTSDVLIAVVVGLLGLVIGLSLQATLANMISGIFLLYDGAIRVGDRIEHFAIRGVVVRVALRNTWVRTEEGRIAVIGNTKLADGPTLNIDLAPRFDRMHQPPEHTPLNPFHLRHRDPGDSEPTPPT